MTTTSDKRCTTNAPDSCNDQSQMDTASIFTEEDVTIHLDKVESEGEYSAFTSISVDIFLQGKKVGRISGTRIDRQRIPERSFYYAMDSHSADLEYVAETLFEPRFGRPQLSSLKLQGDDPEFDVLYIESLQVDEEYEVDGSSDIGTFALRKLLHHSYIKGNIDPIYNLSAVSSCVYIMDGMTPQSRSHANQFLRNGFFQDKYLSTQEGGDRFLVAAQGHWKEPLKSHAEAVATEFHVFQMPLPPSGKDADILRVVNRVCGGLADRTMYQSEISQLIDQGGSLARSKAIFVACAHQHDSLVDFILQKDPLVLNTRDEYNCTPLMMAAAVAAGSATKDGIPLAQPILRRMLAAGAQKELVNSRGMTAYGILMQTHKQYGQMMEAMTGESSSTATPGLSELQSMLMPPGGPTIEDQNGGILPGFVDFRGDDREIGYCDSDSEEEDNGFENCENYAFMQSGNLRELALEIHSKLALMVASDQAAAGRDL